VEWQESMDQIRETEVLVIGCGGAGCRAAYEACRKGVRVTIVTKGKFGRSGTTAFRVADTAGFNVADGVVDPDDCPEEHYRDIISVGMGMAYPQLARVLAEGALETIPFLQSLGVSFEKDPATGLFIEVKGCFASRPRMHILKDHGERIIQAFLPRIHGLPISIVEDTFISRLLVQEGRCVGAVGLDAEGLPAVFLAKSVILAAGGAGQLFTYTLTPPDITGDGYALGLRAGADLVNMEFMQVVVGTVAPTWNQLNAFLWSTKPRFLNGEGESFFGKYLPAGVTAEECLMAKATHFPFSTRDLSRFVEIAIQKEILSQEGSRGKVFLDLTEVTDAKIRDLPPGSPLPKVWPMVKEFLHRRGFAIEKEPVRIGCFAHAINGGLKIDPDGGTTIPGLYAAGEVAGGPHGADRLGGNMLVTCQVFGARAGQAAADKALHLKSFPVPMAQVAEEMDSLNRLRQQRGAEKIEELRRELQEAMWKGVLVIRTAQSLGRVLEQFSTIQERMRLARIQDGGQVRMALELQNLIDAGTAIARAALHRTESRGSHYREDYPALDPAWNKRILIRQENGKIHTRQETA
jgi:succinate dehydrogenase/fumarate reductase flavoprotein subunit